jgi:hypothetical protein
MWNEAFVEESETVHGAEQRTVRNWLPNAVLSTVYDVAHFGQAMIIVVCRPLENPQPFIGAALPQRKQPPVRPKVTASKRCTISQEDEVSV